MARKSATQVRTPLISILCFQYIRSIEYCLMDFLKDLWGFLKTRKKFWLAPVILVLLVLGVLLVIGGSSALAPFIYSLF
jgi:hypothetical protein